MTTPRITPAFLVTLGRGPGEITALDRALLKAVCPGGWLHESFEAIASGCDWVDDVPEDLELLDEVGRSTLKSKPAYKVLTYQSPKTLKGEKEKVLTSILYLAPHQASGKNVCPFATGQIAWKASQDLIHGKSPKQVLEQVKVFNKGVTAGEAKEIITILTKGIEAGAKPEELSAALSVVGCVGTCLGPYSGRGVMGGTKTARLNRTRKIIDPEKRAAFIADIDRDIQHLQKVASRENMRPATRLNGTSEIDWTHPDFWHKGVSLFARHPSVQFYDYTKNIRQMKAYLAAKAGKDKAFPQNYYLTFSYNGYNWPICRQVLDAGGNISMAFRIRAHEMKPLSFDGYKCIDGDTSDIRFYDDKKQSGGKGVIVALAAKGSSHRVITSFIVSPLDKRLVWPTGSKYAVMDADPSASTAFNQEWQDADAKEKTSRYHRGQQGQWREMVHSAAMADEDFVRDVVDPVAQRILKAKRSRKFDHPKARSWFDTVVLKAIKRFGGDNVMSHFPGKKSIPKDQLEMLSNLFLYDVLNRWYSENGTRQEEAPATVKKESALSLALEGVDWDRR